MQSPGLSCYKKQQLLAKFGKILYHNHYRLSFAGNRVKKCSEHRIYNGVRSISKMHKSVVFFALFCVYKNFIFIYLYT